MALTFTPPPDWMLKEYMDTRNPVQQAGEGVQNVLQTYLALKQQQDQMKLAQSASNAKQFEAVAPYLPEDQVIPTAQKYGLTIPPAGTVPPQASSGTVAGMVPPGATEPIIAHFAATRARPTSKAGLEKYKKDLDIANTEQQMAERNTPVPVMTRAQALKAGRVSPRTKIFDESPAGFGKPPAGFQWKPDGSGLEPIPGGPVALKQDAETEKVKATFDLYETARDGLLKGLASSKTGPVIGRMPAVTSNQQIAEGAVAAMAPVLKQLFRVAGEGIFTDRDQELLLEMIPTRATHPEAIAAQIQNIDNIVKAKLGIGKSGGLGPHGPTVTQNGHTYTWNAEKGIYE